MKRLLLSVVFGSFLTLVGLQAAHTHSGPVLESCAVCAVGGQAQAHAPNASPRLEPVLSRRIAIGQADETATTVFAAPHPARGPPSLS